MTWLNNPTNNEFQIRSKLDIDITKLYWDNPAYGANYGFSNANGILIPLRFGTKKIICGSDFVNISNPTNDQNPFFVIDTTTFNLSNYIYYIKVNANIKGFNSNNTDGNILKSNFKAPAVASTQDLSSGLRLVFFNPNANGLGNPISTNLDLVLRNQSLSDTIAPFTGRIQCLGGFPYFRTLSGFLVPNEYNFTSLRTINSLYSLHSLNKNIEPWITTSSSVSNPYQSNKLQPIDHFSFDLFLIKEYTFYRNSTLNNNSAGASTLSQSIITKDPDKSMIDYDYMSFFICSSTNNPFMYSSGNLTLNDIISNIEIEIIRYLR